MRTSVIGAGYVGLVVSAALAKLGHIVKCFDINQERIKELNSGRMPIYEPGLSEAIADCTARDQLSFSHQNACNANTDCFIVCVGTPPRPDGKLNVDAIHDVTEQIAFMQPDAKVAIKSTLMPGTCRTIKSRHPEMRLVCWPEKLRQGSAMKDFAAEQVVVGCELADEKSVLYDNWLPVIPHRLVRYEEAELSKLALNGYLAGRVSYVNVVAGVCEAVGADVTVVQSLLSLDPRVGGNLYAGPGYGGSCFPKDLEALATIQTKSEPLLLAAIAEANDEARKWPTNKLVDLGLHTRSDPIAIWGLTFKADTSDLRESPAMEAVKVIKSWHRNNLRAYDPSPIARAGALVKTFDDALSCVRGAKALVVMTEWDCFKMANMAAVKDVMLPEPVLLDCRNLYDPIKMRAIGFEYYGIGRA